MSIWLIMKTADGGERRFPVRDRIVIGRETRCQVRIALPTVSDRHCELRPLDGALHLCDLQSDIGTYHNGNRVDKAQLQHCDLLTIGPVTFQVRFGSPTASIEAAAQPVLPPEVAGQADTLDMPEVVIKPRTKDQASRQ